MAYIPPGVPEIVIREAAVDELSHSLVNIDSDFARIIRAEYAKFHRMPPVASGESTRKLWLALTAFRAKIDVIRNAANLVLQCPQRKHEVLRILSEHFERTGLTEGAREETPSVMDEVSRAIRT